MKYTRLMAAVMALAMGTGQFALAQDGVRHGDTPDYAGQRNDQRNDQRGARPGRGPQTDRRGERGAGPNQQFYRGGRLPPEYRSRQYVVEDWRGHQLSSPPRGYHWVQTGGDYVLVAIATGLIMQVLLNGR